MQKVHFIGIGGIGISALARHYLSVGWTVSGSDASDSQLIQDLIQEGINVKVGPQVAENIPVGVTKVIYTVAVKADNEEFVAAQKTGAILMTYPQALGEMTKSKKTIAVCGTHGKTTTTAMVYEMLLENGVDASMIVGSLIEHDGKKTNYLRGESEWIVIEACEYRQSFLNYFPDITIITNIDADHLDFYKDLKHIKKSFGQFVDNIKEGGKVIVHNNENYIDNYSENLKIAENGKSKIEKVASEDFINEKEVDGKIILNVPGKHNRQNAALVYTLGKILGFTEDKILQGLKNFKGTWRRQEYKGKINIAQNEIIFYDDYAHHPHEIRATLAAFREKYSDKKIAIAFMPHLFSRTKLLFTEFADELAKADKVLLMPIYKSRETFDPSISSEMLAEKINATTPSPSLTGGEVAPTLAKTFSSFEDLKKEILSSLSNDTIVITMGAGNIDDVYKILELKK